MKIKFRDLVNPTIVNAEWIGFNGDSEYKKDDDVKMGSWSLIDIDYDAISNNELLELDLEDGTITNEEEFIGVNWNLDDSIPESLLNKGLTFEVENDKGHLCSIQLNY